MSEILQDSTSFILKAPEKLPKKNFYLLLKIPTIKFLEIVKIYEKKSSNKVSKAAKTFSYGISFSYIYSVIYIQLIYTFSSLEKLYEMSRGLKMDSVLFLA